MIEVTVRNWIKEILVQNEPLVAIAMRQRAKFEGWLKFEIAAYAEQQGATNVRVESPSTEGSVSRCRSDVTFWIDGARYDIELKTPNTNWRLEGVENRTRTITDNVSQIVADGGKLTDCVGQGIVAFVLFPVPTDDNRWTEYLRRISDALDIRLSADEHTTRVPLAIGVGQTALSYAAFR